MHERDFVCGLTGGSLALLFGEVVEGMPAIDQVMGGDVNDSIRPAP